MPRTWRGMMRPRRRRTTRKQWHVRRGAEAEARESPSSRRRYDEAEEDVLRFLVFSPSPKLSISG